MTQQEAVKRWQQSAREDIETARVLFDNKRYLYTLFFCHLSLEKMLKALIVARIDDAAPPIHNLLKLAEIAGISGTPEQIERLKEITTFNIEARYDIYKDRLYKKAILSYTQQYLSLSEELLRWVETQIQISK